MDVTGGWPRDAEPRHCVSIVLRARETTALGISIRNLLDIAWYGQSTSDDRAVFATYYRACRPK